MTSVYETVKREPVQVPGCFGCAYFAIDTNTKQVDLLAPCVECGIKKQCLLATQRLLEAAKEVFK